MSNKSTDQQRVTQDRHAALLMAATARYLFGNPTPQYLNAIPIAANQAIADTGVMFIFIMDDVDVVNKCTSRKPITINLPDDRKVMSTHECNIKIPAPTKSNGTHHATYGNCVINQNKTHMQSRMHSNI